MSNTVFFDLETKYLAQEVGGWNNIHKMELAVAVTYATADGQFRHFTEDQADQLVAELQRADLVVGFNLYRFDYTVLQPYTSVPLNQLPTVDMLRDIYRRLGFRVKLDSLAEATLGVNKSADGVQAVRWFRQGKIEKVLAYCEQDVRVTRDVYLFGQENGWVSFFDKFGRRRRVSVSW